MKVIIYEPDYNEKHRTILRALAAGIPGAQMRPVTSYKPCDVAVIFGGVKKSYPPTWSKRTILDNHKGRSLLMVESGFFRRGEYYQIGWGGAAGHGDFNTGPDTPLDRFHAMQQDRLRPWRLRPNGPVIVCGQLPDVDHIGWVQKMTQQYPTFRPHPKTDVEIYRLPPDVRIDARPLAEVFQDAKCLVTWNSTIATEAAIAGVPTIACDRGSMAWPVAGRFTLDFTPARAQWLAGLGYSQWTLDEMREGLPWKHLTS